MTKNFKYFLIAFVLSLPLWWGVNIFQGNLENLFYANVSQPLENLTLLQIPERPQKPVLEIIASAALSIEIKKNGQELILFQKNPEKIVPIASLTKLMTALIVLEEPSYNLENTLVIISKEAADQGDAPNIAGNLKKGEKFKIIELLNLMLAYSSNDAAFALSEVIDFENFIEKMNQKAKNLEMQDTYFFNPTGLDLKNENSLNYSTAKDLTKLTRYILENEPLIFELSLKSSHDSIENGISNLVLKENQKIIGGKTGYTELAKGSVLFVFQNENGNICINLVLGAESEESRIQEIQKLAEWVNL